MRPFEQGDLDGLCGVYSVVNAIRLIGTTDTDASESVFIAAVKYVEDKRRLYRALTQGLTSRVVSGLLRDVAGQHGIFFRMPFRKRSGVGLGEFWGSIQQHVMDGRGLVLLGMEGKHSHWTLVQRASSRSLVLHDSYGLRRLYRSRCTTGKETSSRLHILCPSMTFFLRAQASD